MTLQILSLKGIINDQTRVVTPQGFSGAGQSNVADAFGASQQESSPVILHDGQCQRQHMTHIAAQCWVVKIHQQLGEGSHRAGVTGKINTST